MGIFFTYKLIFYVKLNAGISQSSFSFLFHGFVLLLLLLFLICFGRVQEQDRDVKHALLPAQNYMLSFQTQGRQQESGCLEVIQFK